MAPDRHDSQQHRTPPVDHGNMGATETINLAQGDWHRGTLSADCAITVSGFTADDGLVGLVKITQDGTGAHAITWDTDIVFAASDQPGQEAGDVTWFLLWSDEGDATIYGAIVGGSGGSSAITIRDDGSDLTATPSSIDFVGAGVTATAAGDDVTVTIPGTPVGAAGGDLSGTYPNPSVVDDSHNHSASTAPGTAGSTHWEPVVYDNAGTPEIVFTDVSGVWDIVMHEVAS